MLSSYLGFFFFCFFFLTLNPSPAFRDYSEKWYYSQNIHWEGVVGAGPWGSPGSSSWALECCRSCLQHPGVGSWLLPNMWWEMITPRGQMRTGWGFLQNTRKKSYIWLPNYTISGVDGVWIWTNLFKFILISWIFAGKYFDRSRTSGCTKIKLQGNTLHNFSFIFFGLHKQM